MMQRFDFEKHNTEKLNMSYTHKRDNFYLLKAVQLRKIFL